MESVKLLTDLPSLRRPVLVAAFEGWNDAGDCASQALGRFHNALDGRQLAVVDPEPFFDFQLVRPTVSNTADGSRRVIWPETRLSTVTLQAAEHDLVLLRGPEPNFRWRSFTDELLELAAKLGVGMVVTTGALQVDVPHTRPVPVTATSPDPGLAAALGLSRSTYEGPTGITGVLHAAAAAAGFQAVSVWAGVPHYLAAAAYLPGVLALMQRLAALLGVQLSLDGLARDAHSQTEDIAELLADDEELAAYVHELEQRLPVTSDDVAPHLMTGEQLAAEVERFLRDRE